MGVITFHEKFSHRIGSLLEGDFTDAFLLVEGVEIPVHRCILAAHSEYFKNSFSSKRRKISYQMGAASGSKAIMEGCKVSNSNLQFVIKNANVTSSLADNVIELNNTKVEVVRAVLDYFYKGQYDYHENVETHLLALELAHQFRLKDLEETLIDHIGNSVSQDSFVQFYNMKSSFKNDKLVNSFLSYMKKNGEEIVKSDSFAKLSLVSLLSLLDEESFAVAEIDIFRAAERWTGVNKPDENTVKVIVNKIRLATMSLEDLFYVVSKSKKLPEIDILEALRSILKKDAASTNFRQQQHTPVADLNVAQSSLGAEILSGSVIGATLISGSSGCTFHKVGGKPDSIAVKLNQTYRLNAIHILLDSNGEKSYKYYVEVSDNNKEWLRVVDHTNFWCRSHQFLRFDPRAVKFIRMTGTHEELKVKSLEAMYTNKECSLVEGIPVASTNVVLESRGGTVTGGSEDSLLCIDGNENSCAILFDNSPLIIKLGQPYWLSSLRVRISTSSQSYIIESSPDGKCWQPVGDDTDGEEDTVWRTIDFSHRVVLHFRVIKKKLGSSCIELYHFESPASTIAVTN